MCTVVLVFGVAQALQAQTPAPYRDARLPVAERVRDLLGRMTLEEKFWQLFMIPGDLDDSTHNYSTGAFGLQINTGIANTVRSVATRNRHGQAMPTPPPIVIPSMKATPGFG